MRRYSLPLVILISIVIAACLTGLALAEGRAESTPLAAFKRVDVTGMAVIDLVQDTNGPLLVSLPDDAKVSIDVKVQKETLFIRAADGRRWWDNLFGGGPTGPARITLHFKDLESIDVAGGVRITAREIRVPALRIGGSGGTTIQIDELQATTLTIDGSGALKAELNGKVTDQNISISGAADYRGAKLISDNASVDVSGAGKIVVNVSKKLNANISGAGVVEYIGDPVVKQNVSGVGRVKRRETAEIGGPHIAARE